MEMMVRSMTTVIAMIIATPLSSCEPSGRVLKRRQKNWIMASAARVVVDVADVNAGGDHDDGRMRVDADAQCDPDGIDVAQLAGRHRRIDRIAGRVPVAED